MTDQRSPNVLRLTLLTSGAVVVAALALLILRPRPAITPAAPIPAVERSTPEKPAESNPAAGFMFAAPVATRAPTVDDPTSGAPLLTLNPAPPAREPDSAMDATARAQMTFASLSHLPEESLASTTEQAISHLPDADYAAVALPIVTDPQTHGQAMSVLFADLMERPDSITLPALLLIARNPAHPFAPSALDNLRLLLNQNHGSDWPQWEAAISQKLAPKTKGRGEQ